MSNAVTEAQIEAYRRAKQIAHGCIYGCYNKYENRHYIVDRSHEVWSMCSDDYEAGHAAMMAEVDRLRDVAALSAALSVEAQPVNPLKAENAAKIKAVLDWADTLPDAWLIRDPTGQIDTTATTRPPLPSETLEILNLYLHPPAPAPVKPLELLDPADDEAMDWITSNLMAIRRDNGSMEYGLTAVVRAFQAGAKTTAVVIKEAACIVENFPSNDGVIINRFEAATAVRHLLTSIYTSPEQGETDV